MASSARGRLGSATAGINVFQDFFVDIDFPVALTQHDEVSVPVAVYNYLKTDQAVRLEVAPGDWFELRSPAVQTLTLGPGEVRAVHFPIVARKIGFQKFTVTARGANKSDAVARSVEVVPDGKEFLVSQSGRLEGKIAHTIDIPPEAIEGASKIFVKVYPGMMSQVVEGLDKMLRMPGGCFEQTSSSTYPNVLVLDYMKTSGKITPELQMKAEGFINAGYQRLVSFEVPGGGFEWFGQAPAHSILTAYGLMEFYDMSKVHPVDPAIIARTQQWLARLQQPDGSFRPSAGGIAEGAINKMQDNILRNTAYTVWALASTEYSGPELPRGADFLRGHLDEMKDNYTLALAANALATVDAQGRRDRPRARPAAGQLHRKGRPGVLEPPVRHAHLRQRRRRRHRSDRAGRAGPHPRRPRTGHRGQGRGLPGQEQGRLRHLAIHPGHHPGPAGHAHGRAGRDGQLQRQHRPAAQRQGGQNTPRRPVQQRRAPIGRPEGDDRRRPQRRGAGIRRARAGCSTRSWDAIICPIPAARPRRRRPNRWASRSSTTAPTSTPRTSWA